MWVCSVGGYGDRGHDGEGLRRRRDSVVGEAVAMAKRRARERGEKRQGLTAVRMKEMVSSGAA